MQVWMIEFCFAMFVAFLGLAAGWWLRGRGAAPAAQRPKRTERKQVAEQALQGLHAAAETVRSCVQQHIDCMHAIQSELQESSATEPAVISNAAASIIAANGLVQHQFDDIQKMLDSKQEEIEDNLADPYGLLFTFASLDKQKHVYGQVLRSLETLAAELASNMAGHGERLQKISNGLDVEDRKNFADVTEAVGQILDAADEIQQKVDSTEQRIGQQAEKVQMQAILSHVDLLTSLPNRRAFEAEMEHRAAQSRGKSASFAVMLVDLDRFGQINSQYGHQGGDVILRQAAGVVKDMMRGKDMVARHGGDTFAILLDKTSLHDALPIAERVRSTLERTEFTHGGCPLRLTAGLGVAHLEPEESPQALVARVTAALQAAKQAGGNLCHWHDGETSSPISAAFKQAGTESSSSLKAMFSTSISGLETKDVPTPEDKSAEPPATLSGRSLFVSNLQRRLSEWKRGGPPVSVVVLRIDQMKPLVTQFGAPAQQFLQRVLGRLLEAVTRDMDERCEFEDGVFVVLLPGLDEANAFAVAERLQSQVRQTKVRIGDALWNITASIGTAHCSIGNTVVDVMRSADAAMKQAASRGGDSICAGQPVAQEPQMVAR
jgi:diguanylate cyclase (GGDEF)-like protein